MQPIYKSFLDPRLGKKGDKKALEDIFETTEKISICK